MVLIFILLMIGTLPLGLYLDYLVSVYIADTLSNESVSSFKLVPFDI
jgi:hypothetical protein